MTPGYLQSEKMTPEVRKSEAEYIKREPKVSHRELNGSQSAPKGCKGVTKMHQNKIFGKCCEKQWFSERPGMSGSIVLGTIFETNPSNNFNVWGHGK